MADPLVTLSERFRAAITAALGPDFDGADPVLRRSGRADFQANAAMTLGKRTGRPPRDVAQAIVDHLDAGDICAGVDVAGAGFINVTLSDSFIAAEVEAAAGDERLGTRPSAPPEAVVIDYSSPNVAREMHVGHLRSTVIGDSLVRVLEWQGHRVVRQNHLGDWGTQFGMLIEHLLDEGWDQTSDHSIGDLNALYQAAQARFQGDEGFAEQARQRVVLLQSGDEATLALWRDLVDESARHFEAVYGRLGVRLRREDIRGESFYNPLLEETVAELEAKGLAAVDQGALCVFPPGFAGRDGQPLPLIVRYSAGGFGYAATDLAGVRYRVRELGGQRLVYVVDARQSQHFAMVFATAQMAGWLGEGARAEHVPFGTILGQDGRPFRTRTGESIKLVDLLDEAVERASSVVAEKNPDLYSDTRAIVAEAVGIGALKYADLSNDRVKDYVFDWDRMLSFDGNTAPYLQYAHARIRSIFRRGEADPSELRGATVSLEDPAERALALRLLAFDGVLAATEESLQPHRLCTYLFDVATGFTTFYESCPVLRADTEELRRSRLLLCDLTARVLSLGLGLLGIDAPDQM